MTNKDCSGCFKKKPYDCEYLGTSNKDCWLVSGNIFQKCNAINKNLCVLYKNDQLKKQLQAKSDECKEFQGYYTSVLRYIDPSITYEGSLTLAGIKVEDVLNLIERHNKLIQENTALKQDNKILIEALEKIIKIQTICMKKPTLCEDCEFNSSEDDCVPSDISKTALKKIKGEYDAR